MKKEFVCYFIFCLLGFVIDQFLIHLDFTIPYSFTILFLNICLYKIRLKQGKMPKTSSKIFIMFLAFIVLPVLFSLLNHLIN